MVHSHDIQIQRAKHYLALQDYEHGLMEVKDILYEDPDDPDALYLQGMIFTETGHQAEALKALEFYFSQGQSSAEAWEAFGCAHLRLRHWEEAENAFMKALILDPSQGSIWRNFAVLLSQRGKPLECYHALQEAHKLDPDDILTLYALSSAHLHYGQAESAIPLLERLSAPGIPPAIREYAQRSLRKLGRLPPEAA